MNHDLKRRHVVMYFSETTSRIVLFGVLAFGSRTSFRCGHEASSIGLFRWPLGESYIGVNEQQEIQVFRHECPLRADTP